MKPIAIINRYKPIVMELIGKNGKVVGEYVDKGRDAPIKEPYMKIEEGHI